jgi:hypothetical protein
MELLSISPLWERMESGLDCGPAAEGRAGCVPALGYNRAKVDGPLMNATALKLAWTYPLYDRDYYPVEDAEMSLAFVAGVGAI